MQHRFRPIARWAWPSRVHSALFAVILLASLGLSATFALAEDGAIELVMEPRSGRILHAAQLDRLWHPASLTKLMTAYVVFEAIANNRLHLAQPLTPTALAKWQPPVRLGLKFGRTITVEHAIKALILRSSNDVAMMLAEAVGTTVSRQHKDGICAFDIGGMTPGRWGQGGPAGWNAEEKPLNGHTLRPWSRLGYGAPKFEAEERMRRRCSMRAFANLMNLTAKRLGMSRTHFENPNGLPDDRQVTTGRDLARLIRALLHDYPQHAHIFAMENFQHGRRTLSNYNSIVRTLHGGNGFKTGFICASGYNLASGAIRDGKQIVAIVMGAYTSGSRNIHSMDLLELGFAIDLARAEEQLYTLDTHPYDDGGVSGATDITNYVRKCAGYSRRKLYQAQRKHMSPQFIGSASDDEADGGDDSDDAGTLSSTRSSKNATSRRSTGSTSTTAKRSALGAKNKKASGNKPKGPKSVFAATR